MPERLIGAVLKTVVRSRVPWVRIPPPPPFRKSLKRLFFSAFLEFQNFRKQLNLVPKGTKKGLEWQPIEGKKSSRIRKTLGVDISKEENIEQAIELQIKTAEEFKKVFSQYLV